MLKIDLIAVGGKMPDWGSTRNPGVLRWWSRGYNSTDCPVLIDHLKLSRTAALIILVTTCFNAAAISEHTEILYRWQWPEYVTGANVIALRQIHKILSLYEEDEETRIEIRYPGGDDGRLWAESVAGWLTSYGVPGKYMDLLPGSGGADRLAIAFIDRR